jgi:hypothetical protein
VRATSRWPAKASSAPGAQSYGDVIPSEYGTLIGLEAEAATISNYEQELIPGLLQIEDYARAVIRVSRPDDTAEQVSRRAEVRMARQQVLARDDAPRLWAVINEAAVRRVVGGPAVMAAQPGRRAGPGGGDRAGTPVLVR